MHYEGQGVTLSGMKAAVWYRKAADQGNTGVQLILGIIALKANECQGTSRRLIHGIEWRQRNMTRRPRSVWPSSRPYTRQRE